MIADCVRPKKQSSQDDENMEMPHFDFDGIESGNAAPLASDEGWGIQTWFKDYMLAKDLAEQAEDGLDGPEDEIALGKII